MFMLAYWTGKITAATNVDETRTSTHSHLGTVKMFWFENPALKKAYMKKQRKDRHWKSTSE